MFSPAASCAATVAGSLGAEVPRHHRPVVGVAGRRQHCACVDVHEADPARAGAAEALEDLPERHPERRRVGRGREAQHRDVVVHGERPDLERDLRSVDEDGAHDRRDDRFGRRVGVGGVVGVGS